MNDRITLVPAGAGSGKTHRIQTELAGLVTSGAIRADRILAVTFTESAAQELKGRLRGALLDLGRTEDALAIERAYVSTIHALGLRLMTEHAFATGRSPASRLLTEAERDLLIRQEAGRNRALAPVRDDLARFGYAWSPVSSDSAETQFRARVMETADLLRGLGPRGMDPAVTIEAEARICAEYGACADDPDALKAQLVDAVAALCGAFPEDIVDCATSDSARKAFRKDFRALQRVFHNPRELDRDWSLWQALRGLRRSKRGAPTPQGYDELASQVITAADVLPQHPGPRDDACIHLRALVHGAQQAMEAYEKAKAEAGLIDYADMVVETEAILRTRPEVLRAVLDEIDCVVIDEFQDTSPVQFALLWQLARQAPRSLIVGDTKQSIMGFQGADPRLAEALTESLPDRTDPLRQNWRSTPPLMDFVNAIGQKLFPKSYIPLEPTRPDPGLPWLEVVQVPNPRGRQSVKPAHVIAARIHEMLAKGEPVVDRATGQLRPIQPSDIAVLCYRGKEGETQAAALRMLGLPVRVPASGWLNSRATRVAGHALAFCANPADLHAALAFLTLGPPRVSLENALRATTAGTLLDNPALANLKTADPAGMPIGHLALTSIAAAGLREWAAGLEDADAAMADLTRFLAEAEAFDSLAGDLKAAAGFHGSNVQVFLGWLVAQTGRDFDRRPDPDAWSSTGVEVVTWHAAKGREWPVTVVADLAYDWGERGNTVLADFASFGNVDHVLEEAALLCTPSFAAPEQSKAFKALRSEACEAEARRLLYVATTRARDRLILALPPAGKTLKDDFADLLRDRCGLSLAIEGVELAGRIFPARITEAPGELPEIFTTAPGPVQTPSRRFGMPQKMTLRPRTPWRTSPSSLIEAPAVSGVLRHVTLGPRVGGRTDRFNLATERGTAWHLAFRTQLARPDLAHRLSAATGLDAVTLQVIGRQATEVRQWLVGAGFPDLDFETPIQITNLDGSEMNGTIDLLATGPSGSLILDHKSGPAHDPDTRFETYRPQLMAYAEAVGRLIPNCPVRAIGINWMNEGVLTICDLAAFAPTSL